MKLLLLILISFSSFISFSQRGTIKLKNAIIIGQLEKPDDRYSIEIAITEIFTNAGIKAIPSLNVLKIGGDIKMLTNDSVQKIISSKGIDTYMTVSVRGYDKRFKLAENSDNLDLALKTGHLFSIYRDDLVTITFEFTFYREGQFMGTDIIKCGNISSREDVLKRLKKKLTKKVNKWQKK
jgi:hypothetical protein